MINVATCLFANIKIDMNYWTKTCLNRHGDVRQMALSAMFYFEQVFDYRRCSHLEKFCYTDVLQISEKNTKILAKLLRPPALIFSKTSQFSKILCCRGSFWGLLLLLHKNNSSHECCFKFIAIHEKFICMKIQIKQFLYTIAAHQRYYRGKMF